MSTEGMIDKFDRAIGMLDGAPNVDKTKATTIVTSTTLVGLASTFIVQTFRVREENAKGAIKVRDTILVQHVDQAGSYRLVIPPEVSEVIARQRDALTTKGRKRGAAQAAVTRKERGIEPAFLRFKKRAAEK